MDSTPASRPDVAGMAIAGVLLALAAVILWDTASLQLATTYGIGPKAMPYVVAAGLALLSAGNLLMAFRGGFPPREEVDRRAVALILGVAPRLTAVLLAGFTVVASLISHSYWTYPEAQQAAQQTQFFKNAAITGGLLFYYVSGAGSFSLPGLLRARAVTSEAPAQA